MSIATNQREALIAEPAGANGSTNGKHRLGRPSRQPRVLWPWIVGSVAFLAAVTAGGFYLLEKRAASAAASGLSFVVAQGPIVVSVTESGTIKAAQQEILRSEVEGRSTIIHLIPEGTMVKKGDLLVEVDASALQDEKLEDTIAVQNGEAAFIRAREDLEVAKNQALADVAQATLDYDFAKEDLTKYQQGEYPNLLTEAQSKIKIAEEEFKRAASQYEGSQRLFDEKYISETEKEADRLAMNKADLNLKLAEQALKLLEDWEYKRQIAQLTSDVEQKRLALERAERKASADVVQAEAELKAKTSELERQNDKLAKVVRQISRAKILAPRDGLVVYATSAQGGGPGMRMGNQEPLQEGAEVRERQELIYLPTATDMIAEIKIHESSLEKVRLGMPVRITVDALPGRSYRGEVTKIAPLPDAASMWMNPDLKVYNTQIKMTGNGEELRTGMSCRAEIIVENYDNAVYVPVQSIVRVSGVPTAFVVKTDGSLDQREVDIGQDNNRMVVVKTGLTPGEQVLLAPPLGDTGTVETLRPEELSDEEKQKAEEAKNNPGVKPAEMPQGAMNGQMTDAPAGEERAGAAGQAMMKVMQEIQAKATPEEQQKLREFFQNQDMAGGQAYLKELGEKYEIDTSALNNVGAMMRRPQGGEGEGQGGQFNRDGQRGDGANREGGNRGGDGAGRGGNRGSRPAGAGDHPDAGASPAQQPKPGTAQ